MRTVRTHTYKKVLLNQSDHVTAHIFKLVSHVISLYNIDV